MEFLRICREEDFPDVVVSIKASNTVLMVQTVRLLVRTMEAEDMHWPLHLGVTEAGDNEDGRIKSAVGIGALLADGMGDTVRVSLSEPPEAEIPVARKLIHHIRQCRIRPFAKAPDTFPTGGFVRETRVVQGIGGARPPVVISDRSRCGHLDTDKTSCPDFFYTGSNRTTAAVCAGNTIPCVVAAEHQLDTYPCFRAEEADRSALSDAPLKFLELAYDELNEPVFRLLRRDPSVVIVWNGRRPDVIGEARAFACRLKKAQCDAPLILRRHYETDDAETLQLQAAVDFGTLLMDGIGNGVMLSHKTADAITADGYLFSIMQAVRLRISKTEYISCPGCGRTLYDLQATITRIKAATSHLKGLKIGVMGCIVNGPGEMADADYGYVGAGRGHVSLYKGRTCLYKNIPETEAVEQLVQLIKGNGDWRDDFPSE